MANTFAPFGLVPFGGADGAAPTYGLGFLPRLIAYDNSTKIFHGDPVKQLDTGYVAQWTAATAVSQLAGIFQGVQYYSVSTKQPYFNNYWPGADVATNATIKAQVVPINTAVPPIFLVQTGNSVTTAVNVGQAAVGQNADVALGTGNTNTGMSGAYLDINTFGTTATLPFRIIGIYDGPNYNNDPTSANNWVIVQANIYQETGI
jgi:hypothetical protein